MTDPDGDDAQSQRWVDADSVLQQRPTPGARRRRRRSAAARIGLIVGIPLIVVGLVALLGAFGHWPPSTTELGQDPAVQVVGWVLAVAGMLAAVSGLVWMIRAGQFKLAWRSPLVSLSRRDRRRLISLIRRGEAAPADQEALACYLTARMRHQYPWLLLFAGVVMIDSGQAFTNGDALLLWSLPILLALFVVAAVTIIRDANRAGHWLDLHAQSE